MPFSGFAPKPLWGKTGKREPHQGCKLKPGNPALTNSIHSSSFLHEEAPLGQFHYFTEHFRPNILLGDAHEHRHQATSSFAEQADSSLTVRLFRADWFPGVGLFHHRFLYGPRLPQGDWHQVVRVAPIGACWAPHDALRRRQVGAVGLLPSLLIVPRLPCSALLVVRPTFGRQAYARHCGRFISRVHLLRS